MPLSLLCLSLILTASVVLLFIFGCFPCRPCHSAASLGARWLPVDCPAASLPVRFVVHVKDCDTKTPPRGTTALPRRIGPAYVLIQAAKPASVSAQRPKGPARERQVRNRSGQVRPASCALVRPANSNLLADPLRSFLGTKQSKKQKKTTGREQKKESNACGRFSLRPRRYRPGALLTNRAWRIVPSASPAESDRRACGHLALQSLPLPVLQRRESSKAAQRPNQRAKSGE